MPGSLSAVTCGRYVRAEKPPVSTSILRRGESVKGTGRSSDSFLFRRLPGRGASGKRLPELVAGRYRSPGTYSSGNCRRFSRHSLLIPFRAWPGGMGNLCRDKGNINFRAQCSTGSENSRSGAAETPRTGGVAVCAREAVSGPCGFHGRERRCVAVFSLSLRVIEYGG